MGQLCGCAKFPASQKEATLKYMLLRRIKTALLKALNYWLRATASPEDKLNLRRQEQGKPPIIYW